MVHAFPFSPEEGRRRLGKIISILHEKPPLFYTLPRNIEVASIYPQCALHQVLGLDFYLLHDFLKHCQLFKVWRDNLVAWEGTTFYQWKLDLEDAGVDISFVPARPHVGKSRVVLWFLKIGKDYIDHPTTQLNKMELSVITHCILNFNELRSVQSIIYFPDQKVPANVSDESFTSKLFQSPPSGFLQSSSGLKQLVTPLSGSTLQKRIGNGSN